MAVDILRPPTALELLSHVHPIVSGGGSKIEPKASDLSRVVPKPSQSGISVEMTQLEKLLAKAQAERT